MSLTVAATDCCPQIWIAPDLKQDWDVPAAAAAVVAAPCGLLYACLWPWRFIAAGRDCFPSMLEWNLSGISGLFSG